ncbi:hypothetical protein GGQ92_003014 [Gracilibacillus halotolerans]|uniref:LXG domain-containing protein n=1 Tax=Gracilibacillus halotolerans TaxID=74386 RepID=A0A841RQT8_9BACI|nr:hypothetical protein [Gracilibacillus halotolerans]MBB6514192.1 hypothetical protein [Gracilibacillus halotolerans]
MDEFSGAFMLQGMTYQNAKKYVRFVVRPLAKGIIYLSEELIRQNDRYPSRFRSQVSAADVVESEITEQIDAINKEIKRLQEMESSFVQYMIYIYRRMKRNLELKLEKLYTYNTTSASNYETALQLAKAVMQGLEQIQDGGFNTQSKTFSLDGMDFAWVGKLDEIHYTRKAKEHYEDYLKDYPNDLEKIISIIKFEEVNSKYLHQTNEFLEPLDAKDQVEIKYIMYTADEPYRTLSMKYLDRFTIASTDAEIQRFISSEDIIEINISENRNKPRGSYYTFFHEVAHAFDYYYGVDHGYDGFLSDSFTIDDKNLNNHIYHDAEANFRGELKAILDLEDYEHLSQLEKQEMIDNVTNNVMNQNDYYDTLTTEEIELQSSLISLYKEKLDGPDHNTASDTYGGVTNNTIVGSYEHFKDKYYWINRDGTRNREPNRETMAGYYGRIMVLEEEIKTAGIKSIGHYLSNSKDFMDKMLNEMYEE